MEIGPNLALYIASGVDGNIREINGCSIDSKLLSQLLEKPRLNLPKSTSANLSHQTTQASADIIEAVCSVCAVRVSDIKGKSRQSLFVPGTLQCTWFEPLPVCHFQKLQGYLVDGSIDN